MTLRISLLVLVALAGCSRKPGVKKEITAFPAAVAGGFRLGRTFQVPLDGAPPLARKLGLKAEARALYEGSTAMTVVVYEMNTQTAAFELMQKWPKPKPVEPDPKTGKGDEMRRLYFQKGVYFVVVETNSDDASPLKPFTAALEKALQP
ncbi:MAG: hypothetical protein NTY38_19550 [Acidobacteria bacterium]|nr:hypothetical protein [Acidobacteriota bacterium]